MHNRRQFIQQSVYMAAAAPYVFAACSSERGEQNSSPTNEEAASNEQAKEVPFPYASSIGLQLWTVRNQLAEDPKTTLETLATLGYKQVELMDTRQASALLPICKDLGLAVNSSFMLWTSLTGRWDLVPHENKKMDFSEVLDQASEAGLSHLIFGYLTPGERQSLDDYRKWADLLNQAGEKARSQGLQMAYHNHNFEFAKFGENDLLPFDLLAERLDAALMPFELDVFWAAIAGQDPAALIKKYGARMELLHLKDLQANTAVLTDIADVPESAFQALGQGTLAIKELAALGKEQGVQYCFVEQDASPHPLNDVATSLTYLQS